jgi:thymidylate synthase (FAD)
MENNNPWFIEGSSKARLVTATPDGENIIAYVARVTSKDQSNPNIKGLLNYCAKHGHWSVFEQADMTIEVITPLAISIQILRHASMRFQQFSGRYEDQGLMKKYTDGLPAYENMFYMPEVARLQDDENRQNSIVADDPSLTDFMWKELEFAYKAGLQSYRNLINAGFAKEIARFALNEGVYTRLYMKGNVRSFFHYITVRDDEGVAQWEHCEVAKAIKSIFATQFPTIYEALSSLEKSDLEKENLELKTEIQILKAQLANIL